MKEKIDILFWKALVSCLSFFAVCTTVTLTAGDIDLFMQWYEIAITDRSLFAIATIALLAEFYFVALYFYNVIKYGLDLLRNRKKKTQETDI